MEWCLAFKIMNITVSFVCFALNQFADHARVNSTAWITSKKLSWRFSIQFHLLTDCLLSKCNAFLNIFVFLFTQWDSLSLNRSMIFWRLFSFCFTTKFTNEIFNNIRFSRFNLNFFFIIFIIAITWTWAIWRRRILVLFVLMFLFILLFRFNLSCRNSWLFFFLSCFSWSSSLFGGKGRYWYCFSLYCSRFANVLDNFNLFVSCLNWNWCWSCFFLLFYFDWSSNWWRNWNWLCYLFSRFILFFFLFIFLNLFLFNLFSRFNNFRCLFFSINFSFFFNFIVWSWSWLLRNFFLSFCNFVIWIKFSCDFIESLMNSLFIQISCFTSFFFNISSLNIHFTSRKGHNGFGVKSSINHILSHLIGSLLQFWSDCLCLFLRSFKVRGFFSTFSE